MGKRVKASGRFNSAGCIFQCTMHVNEKADCANSLFRCVSCNFPQAGDLNMNVISVNWPGIKATTQKTKEIGVERDAWWWKANQVIETVGETEPPSVRLMEAIKWWNPLKDGGMEERSLSLWFPTHQLCLYTHISLFPLRPTEGTDQTLGKWLTIGCSVLASLYYRSTTIPHITSYVHVLKEVTHRA